MKKSNYLIALALGASTITFAQNVGINTDGSDPDANTILHIKNHSESSLDPAVVRIENEKAGNETGVQIENSGTASSKWDIIVPGSSTDLRIKGNGSDHVTIQNDGDVGIGTTTPVSGLDIQTSMGLNVTTITGATTLNQNHNVILSDGGPYTVTLPAAASNTGKVYYIKNIDAEGNDITIDGNSTETIDGSETYVLDCENDVIRILSNGSNWYIIDEANRTCATTLNAGAVGSAQAICSNTAPAGLTDVTSPTGGTGSYTYQWQSSTDNATWSNISGATSATYSPGTLTTSTYFRREVTSGAETVYTSSVPITVNAIPTADAGAALAAINQGETSDEMGGSVGGGATGGTWSGGSGTWTNATNPSTATYTAGASESGSITLTLTTSGGSCGTTTATKTITVNAPATIPGNAICTGATISATPCSSVSGATINNNVSTTLGTEYNWTGATTSGMSNTSTTQALVDIGGQCWMRYNMNVTVANSWCYNNSSSICSSDGRLYTWSAAMNGSPAERAQGICPTGWHIPSDCEWMYLENTLGMSTSDQEVTGYRNSGNVAQDLSSAVPSGTNYSGFSGLFTGRRNGAGSFVQRPYNTTWWTSSNFADWGITRALRNDNNGLGRFAGGYSDSNFYGYSVRCLKD